MKTIRNLSGIYFKVTNETTGEKENVCFEDLADYEQDEILSKYTTEETNRLVKMLAHTINSIGDQCNIYGS
jgi:hypothetical protein